MHLFLLVGVNNMKQRNTVFDQEWGSMGSLHQILPFNDSSTSVFFKVLKIMLKAAFTYAVPKNKV